jgi:TP901 family phage tail tape measure protein
MAEQLYIEAKLDANQLYKDLEKLKKDVESQSIKANISVWWVAQQADEVSNLDKQVKQAVKSSQELVNRNNELTESIKNQISPTREVSNATANISKQTKYLWTDYQEAARQVSEFIVKLKQLRKEAKWLSWESLVLKEKEILITQDQLNWARSRLRALTEEVSGRTSAWKSMFQWLSKSISTGLFTTFGAFSVAWMVSKAIRWLTKNMKDWIDIAISFESAFAGVRKTVDASEYDLRKFDESLRDMSRTIPRTYEELAKIAELGWQMGIPLDNLSKFTETLAALEVSTDLWLEDAALQISRIANVTNTAFTSVDKIGSAIVDLGNNFAATESEISNFMQRIAGTGTVVWLTVWDIAGIGAAMTSVGIAAEKGWTSVNKMLMAIENAVNQWWEKLTLFAELTGKTVEEFKDKWKRNAGELFSDVVEWLARVWPDAAYYLKELAWGGIRLQETFLNAASAWDVVRSAIEMGNKAYTENIALTEEAAKRYGTMGSQLQMLDNEIRLHKEKLWEELLPLLVGWKRTLLELQEILRKFLIWFMDFIDYVGKWELTMMLSALTIWLTTLNPLLGFLFGLLSAGTIAFKNFKDKWIDPASVALEKINKNIENLNKEIANNDEEIDKLTDSYYKWKISLDEYNEQLELLIEKKLKLDWLQQEAIKDLVAEKATAEMVANSYAAVNKKQEELIKNRKDIAETSETIEELEKKLEKLRWIDVKVLSIDAAKKLKNDIKELIEEIDRLDKKKNDLIISQWEWQQSFERYAEAMRGSTPIIEVWNKNVADQEGLSKAISKIKYDFSDNIEEIKKERRELFLYNKEAEKAALNKITVLEWYFEKRDSNKFLRMRDKLRWTYQKKAKELKDANDELQQALDWDLDDFQKSIQDLAKIELDEVFAFKIDKKSKNELKEHIEQIKLHQDSMSSETEMRGNLNKKRLEAQKALDAIIAKEEAWAKSALANAKTKEDATKAQIKLLELEAQRRIQAAKDNLSNEESVAKEILRIQEWLNDEKKKLSGDWMSFEIENANKIIKKYEELRKEWANAFKDLTKDIGSSSKDIEKLVNEIDKLTKKLSELETKRVEDLGKRYVDVEKTIEDLNERIAELNYELWEQSEEGKTVLQVWDELQDAIKEVTKEADKYVKEIDKIKDKMEDLNKSETDKLSERYAKVTEELELLNKELEKYTKYDILTDADAAKKLELEDKINWLLYEQAKIRQTLRPDQLERAEWMVGETETDKIIREANEKRAAYQQEVTDLNRSLQEQEELLRQYKEQEVRMIEENDNLILDSGEKKYRELLKKLRDYTAERDALLKEQTHLKQLLTQQEIQDAINQSKKTETQLIMDKYHLEKEYLDRELMDYRNQLNEKLASLAQFYTLAAELQRKYGDIGISFSKEDIEQLKEASTSLKGLSSEDRAVMQGQLNIEKAKLQEQEDARKKLENIAKNIDKLLTSANLKVIGTIGLQEMLKEITKLRMTAQWTSSVSNSSVTNNQTFNVANSIDMEVLVREIRKAIKI